MHFQNKVDEKTNISLAISVSSIIFCSIGILGNCICILTCMRKELRDVPTFIFLMVLSFINILKLFTIALCAYVIEFIVQNVEDFNTAFLNITLFILFWEYQSSTYLKVSSLKVNLLN